MASNQILRAIITVLDKTAEPLRQINKRFERLTEPLHHIGAKLGELTEESGLAKVGEHAAHAFEHVKRLGEGLLEVARPLAALGAVGSLAGLVEMAKSTAEFGEQLRLGALKTGLSTEELSGWHYAAKLANVEVEALDKGFQRLNTQIALAAMGKVKDVEAILRQMAFHNTPRHLVSTADALKAISAEAKHLVESDQIQVADGIVTSAVP